MSVNRFIPSLHFDTPEEKLLPEWCKKVVDHYYYNTSNINLLDGKKVDEIEKYASGEFDMEEYRAVFKSIKKSFIQNNKALGYTMKDLDNKDVDDKMQFAPLPLIPVKLNAATSVVSKIPLEVTVTALDALAAKKKDEDISFLANKQDIETELSGITEQLQMGQPDLGTTKHSAIPYAETPYGFDITDPEEAAVFSSLVYQLGVETSLETALQIFYELKKGKMLRTMTISDHLKFGVAVLDQYRSRMTGLPEVEYVHPKDIRVPKSRLPDYSDNTHRIRDISITPMEMFNLFPEEICNEEALDAMLNGKEGSGCYCDCNKIKGGIKKADWNSQKIELIKFEVRSVDAIGVAQRKGKRAFKYFVSASDPRCSYKLWAQNTYQFYWLKNTKYFFDINKLDFSHRTKGSETNQNFTTNIYKSQSRSAVELSIKENKKAQIADIKLQYAILMSLPAGKYLDLKYFRNAVAGLEGTDYTIEYLIDLFISRNIFIGDTQDFDGKHDGQFKPFMDIAGGLKTEITGYMEIIRDARASISSHTGINDELVGQSANPEGLVGLQKLLINGSLNSLYYTNEAVDHQYEYLFSIWAESIKACVEEGGKVKEAVVNMIGSRKVNIIDRLDEIPVHSMGIKISTIQREEERARYETRLGRLIQERVITVADEYTLDAIQNPKDKVALLAIKEKRYNLKKQKEAEQLFNQQQQLIQATGANQMNMQSAKDEGKIKQIYAQGEVEAKVRQLAAQLGLQNTQFQILGKSKLQKDRLDAQTDKSLKTLETKNNLQQQEAIA